jgi:lysozyme
MSISRKRKVTVWLVLVVAILLGVGALWWFLWVPHWRPPLADGERYGIDVSGHQGTIEWSKVASDDIDFAYIKATEGGDFIDDRFSANWRGAEEVGIQRGAYHFFTLCTPGDEQARLFLREVPPDPEALPPAVDLELAGNCSARPPTERIQRELDVFIDLVGTRWKRRLVLYLGNDFESRYPVKDRLDRPLWLRRFLLRPAGEWRIWQLHGYALVDGVEGGVDLNVMRPMP